MTREQAIHSLIAHGFTVEQVGEIVKAVTPQEPRKGHWDKDGACPFCGYFQQWKDDAFCGHCGAQLGEVEE